MTHHLHPFAVHARHPGTTERSRLIATDKSGAS